MCSIAPFEVSGACTVRVSMQEGSSESHPGTVPVQQPVAISLNDPPPAGGLASTCSALTTTPAPWVSWGFYSFKTRRGHILPGLLLDKRRHSKSARGRLPFGLGGNDIIFGLVS